MPTEIDSLQININAKAKNAEDSVDTLIQKLDALSTSLGRVNGSSLSGLANGVQRLGMATQTLKSVKATDYNRIASGFEKFSKIDSSGLSQTANGLNTIAKGMVALSSVPNLQNITPAINAIKNLARVDMSGFDTAKMNTIATTMGNLANQLSSVGKIEGSVTRVVSAMARLSGSGQYIGNVVTYFPQLGNQVVSLVGKLASANTIDLSITKIVDGIARLASAGKKIEVTVANLDKLGKGVMVLLQKLQSAPQLNTNLANTIQGLGNIAVSGSRAGTVVNGLGNNVSRTTSLFKRFSSVLKRTHKDSKGFVSAIGMFYAKFFLVIRAVKGLGSAIGSAQDYIEDFNYFSVALTKVGEDSRDNWKEAGYNSAQEYVDSFKGRFGELQKQMTGYTVDVETGELDYNIGHNLGLDIAEVTRFQSGIAQITNSAGMLGETSIMTSKALSMLSADLSSLSNQDLSAVQDNLQSGLIGQSRALYKYGIDITQAGLQQTAYAHGLDVTVKNLSQASKMQLRLLTILSQSKVAYGDLARTINQPANQLRMLQAGFKNLARTVGQIFLPIIQKIYPYLNAMVMVLQEFAEWIAKLTGVNLKGADTSINLPDYEPAEEGSEAIADNTAKAAKSAKKLSDNLQGFDIINKLDDNDSDNGGNGTPSGNGAGTDIDLSDQIAKALGNYEKIWNQAFKSNENKAVQLAKKIKKALLDGWRKGGDYTEVGKAFANWLNKGMRNISWVKIKSTVNKLSTSLATFLNGAVEELDWNLVGKTLAEGFNTATSALYTFVTTFNWLKFGQKIATGLNSAIKNYDWTKFGQTLGSTFRGIIQTAFGFVTNFDFSEFGKKIGNAINGFFTDMGKVDSKTGLTGWQELGKTLSDSVVGILNTLNTAFATVKWEEVGKSIGQFLGKIDWSGVLGGVGKLISNALFSSLKIAISAFKADPIGFSKALIAVLGYMFAYSKLKGLTNGFKTSLGKVILEGVKTSSFGTAAKTLATTFKTTLASAIAGSKIGSAMIGAITGLKTAITGLATKMSTMMAKAFSSTAFVTTLTTAFAAAVAAAISGAVIGEKINEAIAASMHVDQYEMKVPEAMKKASEEAQEKLESTLLRTKDVKQTIDGINKSVQTTDGSSVKDLASRYYELSQKTKPTASDIAVMKEYSKKLSDMIPGFSKNVDKQTGAFKGSKKTLDGMIDSLDKAAKAEAAYNSSVKLYETEQKNNKAIEEKTKELGELTKKYESVKQVTEQVAKRSGRESAEYQAQVRLLGTYANQVNACSSELNSLKESNKDVASQIKKNNNIMEYAEVKTSTYSNATKKLKKSMENFGVKAEISKKIINDLKTKLENGEISWKQYKNLVDGNYTSVEQLNTAIGKLSPKSVSVTANVSGASSVEKISTEVNNLPETKGVSVNVNISKGAKKVQELYNKIEKGANFPVYVKYGITEEAKSQLAKLPKPGGDTAFGKALKTTGIAQMTNYLDKLPTIKAYKTGGFIEDGLFTMNKGEIAGKFDNGKSVVANNQQITDGIAKAVAPAVYSAMVQALSNSSNSDGTIVINLDGKKIAENTIGHVNQMTKSRGRNPIVGLT